MPTIVVLLFVVHVFHTCQVYCPACTTSVLAYPRAAYNPFQVRRLVDLVLSHPIDAGLMVKLKPRLPLLREMRRLCSLAEVTYSEFGMSFDRNITARYAARVVDLESLTSPDHALLFALCILRSRPQVLRPTVALLCLGRGDPFSP